MAAAAESCAMRIVATASVGPSLPMPSMTVTVMASASTPPNQQYFGAAPSAAKLPVRQNTSTSSDSAAATHCTKALVSIVPMCSLRRVFITP